MTRTAQVELRSGRVEGPAVHANMVLTAAPPTLHRLRSRAARSAVLRVKTNTLPREPLPYGLTENACQVILHTVDTRFLRDMESHDVASIIRQALPCPAAHARPGTWY
jgi:hypothetical protein